MAGTGSRQAAGEFGSIAGLRVVSPGEEGTGHLGRVGSDSKPPECLRPPPSVLHMNSCRVTSPHSFLPSAPFSPTQRTPPQPFTAALPKSHSNQGKLLLLVFLCGTLLPS